MALFFSKKISEEAYDVLPEFTKSNDMVNVSKYSHKVIRDIMAILTTMLGRTLYRPDYGTSVLLAIWDLNNELTLDTLKSSLKSSFDRSLEFTTKEINIIPEKKDAVVTIVLKLSEKTDLSVLIGITKNGYITLTEASELTTNYIINEID